MERSGSTRWGPFLGALILTAGLALELLLGSGPLARGFEQGLPPVAAAGTILSVEDPGLAPFLFSSVDVPLQCTDGIDNDGDGLVDFGDDPGCPTLSSSSEDVSCGIGLELALVLAPLIWLRRRGAQRGSR